MIFLSSALDLSSYNPNPQWGCYKEPVFSATDILLQANGFSYISGDVTVTISVCNTLGVVQEDATSYFNWSFGYITISGTNYYYVNIQGNEYSPYMISNRCFTVQVVVVADGVTVFSKVTEQYEVLSTDVATPASGVSMDGTELVDCLPSVNPALCVGFNSTFVNFKTSFDCYDAFTGDIYTQGSVVLISGEAVTYFRKSWINARLRYLPSEVQRIISINCRTQKTSTTEQLVINGETVFPVWKMREIQGMLLGNNLYVDDVSYQSIGGKIFEQFGKPYNCQYVYKMTLPLQQCFKWQTFGCTPSCDALAMYYHFPDAFSRIYDDSYRLVAASPAQLKIYFDSITGTSFSQDMPFTLPCPTYALFKVISSGVLPKFLYVDEPIPSQRVFGKSLPANTVDLTALCNGITNNNTVPVPDITGENDEQINVPVPDITGEDDVDYDAYTLSLEAESNWQMNPSASGATSYAGQVTLNISISTNYFTTTPYVMQPLCKVSEHGQPSRDIIITDADNGNMPPSSSLLIDTGGNIWYSGNETSIDSGTYYVELFMIKYDL